MLDIEALRADTPGCVNVIHLNNAGSALAPSIVTDTVVAHLRREEEIGGYEAYAEAKDRVNAVYGSIGRLINAPADHVALVESATVAWDRGLQAIAFSDPLQPGDRMLVSGSEYASNVLPLLQLAKRTGATIEVIPDAADGAVDVDAFATMLDDRVRIVSINHAPSQNGLLNDVAAIGDVLRLHASSAWYLVDACQSVGQLPVDRERIGCDVLSATGRKFLRGPRATGFLVVSQRMLDELEPFPLDLHAATWTAIDSYDVASGAARFESWEKPYAALLGLGAAVDYALACGLESSSERIGALAHRARTSLVNIPGVTVRDRGSTLTGIVTIRVGDPAGLVSELRSRGINTSLSTPDYSQIDFGRDHTPGLVRISPHAYNTEDEVDQAIDVIAELVRS